MDKAGKEAFFGKMGGSHDWERGLVERGKLSPIKTFRQVWKNGIDGNGDWALKLRLTARDTSIEPLTQPAYVILTVEGLDEGLPVYEDGLAAIADVHYPNSLAVDAGRLRVGNQAVVWKDPEMDGAWLGLAGVVVGSATSFAATWVSTQSGAKDARAERVAARAQEVREALGAAYLDATEALQWLSNQHVEDSVNKHFAESYEPRTEAALQKLRESRRAFGMVAARGVTSELSELCMQVSNTLNALDDAWRQSQEYAKKRGETTHSEMSRDLYKRMFDTNYRRLLVLREALTGLDGGAMYHEEVDQGIVLAGSLLHRVRESIGTVEDQLA